MVLRSVLNFLTHWTTNMDSKSSAIHDHYEMPECLKGTFKAKCKYCPTSISATGKTTSNLITHMKVSYKYYYMYIDLLVLYTIKSFVW